MITNEELIRKNEKLVYYTIHHWSTKPFNYMDHFYDVANDVFLHLCKIPLHGSRRENPSYVNTVIQTTITNSFKKIKRTAKYNVRLPSNSKDSLDNDTADYDSLIDTSQSPLETDFWITFENIFEKLTLDEKIVLTAYYNLGGGIETIAISKIAKMIYKDKAETTKILHTAQEKVKQAFTQETI